jgi:molybdate transport system permease protein
VQQAGKKFTVKRGAGLYLLVGASVLFLAILAAPLAALYVKAPKDFLILLRCCYLVGSALKLTLYTSIIATFFAFLLGLPVAYVLARMDFRGKQVMDAIVELPLTLPPIVLGVGLLFLLGRQGILGKPLGLQISFTTVAVVIAQFIVSSPFFIRMMKAGLEAVPIQLENASLSLGASRWRTFFRVTLPLCKGSLVGGLAMTWARAVGEFGATLMFAGNFQGRTQTAPLAIYTYIAGGGVEVGGLQIQGLDVGVILAIIVLTVCVGVFALVKLLVKPTTPLIGT